jgi:murein DD-endopeptidase MepM/ murein hydrolase activator NlpD
LSLQINDKQSVITNNIKAVSLGIRQLNEFEQNNLVATILSKDDFTTAWNDIDNMATVSDFLREDIIKLKEVKSDLEYTRVETTDAKNELLTLKSKLADQKKIVEQNTKEKNKLLAQTKNNETSYQKLLKDRIAKKDAFEKELRDYESQLKYILDPSKLPNGGVFSWPLDYIYVTQFFGKTEAGKRLYANGTHNGTDFRAPVGTILRAMADGVVAGTGDTDIQCPGVSFGRFILIKYNNGLASTYGHMSLIKVHTGEKVTRGQIVGYTGNTGYSTGPHLHLSVYAKDAVELKTLPSKSCPGRVLTQPISPVNAYLDPMYYLPPYVKK